MITPKNTPRFPVVLMGRDFWNPLIDWMRRFQLTEHGFISPEDLEQFEVTDEVERAVSIVESNYRSTLARLQAEAEEVTTNLGATMTGEGTRTGRPPGAPPVGPYEDLTR
jgi:predicted Rossmann-fold nucleotide-binding protein